MPFKGLPVFVYEYTTGQYLEELPSCGSVDKKYGACKGSTSDALSSYGRIPSAGILVSKTKHDVFPLDTLPKNKGRAAVSLNKEQTEIQKTEVASPSTLLSEEQLRQKHDMFFMIMTYVNKIPAGKFVEEGQMLRELGLYGKPRYRDALNRIELKDNKGKVDGTIYYGNSESIKKLKNEGVLQ